MSELVAVLLLANNISCPIGEDMNYSINTNCFDIRVAHPHHFGSKCINRVLMAQVAVYTYMYSVWAQYWIPSRNFSEYIDLELSQAADVFRQQMLPSGPAQLQRLQKSAYL